MLLMTTIIPRRDGTVILRSADGTPHVFKPEQPGGELVCDVTDDATVAFALLSGNFEPVLEADYDKAKSLIEPMRTALTGDEQGDDDDDDDDGDVAPDALPVEANTEPVPAAVTRRRKRAN